MPNAVLFAGSDPLDFLGGIMSRNTTFVDTDYVPAGFTIGYAFESGRCTIPLPGEHDDLWLHFRARTGTSTNKNGTGAGVGFHRDEAPLATAIKVTGINLSARVYDNGLVAATGPTTLPGWVPSTYYTFDFNFYHDDDDLHFDCYLNGTLFSSAQTTLAGGPVLPDRITLASFFGNTSTSTGIFSEVLVTSGLPTIGLRLAQLSPIAAGTYSEMFGDYTDLNDPTEMVSVVGSAPGQRFSWEPSPYLGPGSPLGVHAVAAGIQHSRFMGTPTDVEQMVRVGGNDFYGAKIPSGILRSDFTTWWENPDTGQPWSPSDLANLEVGFRVTD